MHHNAARRLEGRPGVGAPGEIMGRAHRLEFEKGPGDGRKPVLAAFALLHSEITAVQGLIQLHKLFY